MAAHPERDRASGSEQWPDVDLGQVVRLPAPLITQQSRPGPPVEREDHGLTARTNSLSPICRGEQKHVGYDEPLA
jgi:hypothetical protein